MLTLSKTAYQYRDYQYDQTGMVSCGCPPATADVQGMHDEKAFTPPPIN